MQSAEYLHLQTQQENIPWLFLFFPGQNNQFFLTFHINSYINRAEKETILALISLRTSLNVNLFSSGKNHQLTRIGNFWLKIIPLFTMQNITPGIKIIVRHYLIMWRALMFSSDFKFPVFSWNSLNFSSFPWPNKTPWKLSVFQVSQTGRHSGII